MEHQATRQMRAKSMHLLDLDQNLIVSICKMLCIEDKFQLRMVSRSFRDLLDDPAPESGIWGVVYLHDFNVDHTLAPLYRWLLKCAPGIQSLRYLSTDDIPVSEIGGVNINKQQLFMAVLPKLARLLPKRADLQFDMQWAVAEALFARPGEDPHGPEYMSQYWLAFSGFLTRLEMVFNENVGPEMCSALNQLLRLQSLEMSGRYRILPAAVLHLQLPRLKRLLIEDFGSTTVSLKCPRLKTLMMFNLFPLHKFSGMPDGIETLKLEDFGIGSVPVEQMLPEQGLKHLSSFSLRECPGLMHLARSLDPFLDMTNLVHFSLSDYQHQQGESDRWTPAALGLLGLAERRVLRAQSVPGGKVFSLSY